MMKHDIILRASHQARSAALASLAILTLFLAIPTPSRADILAAWDVDGVDVADGTDIDEGVAPFRFTAGTKHANVTDAKLSLGSGVNPTTTASQFGFKISAGHEQATLAGAIASNHYIQCTLSAASGYVLNLSSLEMNAEGSSTGADDAAILTDIDGFSNGNEIASLSGRNATGAGDLDTDSSGFGAPIDLSAVAYQGISSITFRLYGWNTGGSSGTTYIRSLSGNDLVINGTVEAIGSGSLSAPTLNPVSQTNATAFMASWHTVDGADGYRLDVSTNHAFGNFQNGYQNRDVGNLTTHTVTGLLSQVTYYYRLQAYDTGGAGAYSATQQVTTVQKTTPSTHATGFGASLTTHRTIVLNWTDAATGEIPDGYIVRGSLTGFADIPVPVDGADVANSYTWNTGYYAHRIEQGEQTDELTDLTPVQTYYFKLFPVANSDDASVYKTDGTVPQLAVTTGAAPFEDFEDQSKTGYEAGSVSFDSGDWWLENANIGVTTSDRKADQSAIRIRHTGSLTMLFNVTNAETIALEYASYGTDTGAKFVVEYSRDNGANWTLAGSEVTCSDSVETASFKIHSPAPVRMRIRKTAVSADDNRMNIDNVCITPYEPEGGVFLFY